ncbi:hypothetical protein ABZY34_13350 [Streptomyces virginiae]|uniref:hypothetical protein n=1 Tax=Streptomyces virginiae TaxID=1961 RepID=UPI0033B30D53
MLFPVDGHQRALVEFDGSRWHRDTFDRDPRKTPDIERHHPRCTVVRVREEPLELTRPTDVAVPHLADAFTTASTVIHPLMALMAKSIRAPGFGWARITTTAGQLLTRPPRRPVNALGGDPL